MMRLDDLHRSFGRRLRAEGKSERTVVIYGQAITFYSRWLEAQGRDFADLNPRAVHWDEHTVGKHVTFPDEPDPGDEDTWISVWFECKACRDAGGHWCSGIAMAAQHVRHRTKAPSAPPFAPNHP